MSLHVQEHFAKQQLVCLQMINTLVLYFGLKPVQHNSVGLFGASQCDTWFLASSIVTMRYHYAHREKLKGRDGLPSHTFATQLNSTLFIKKLPGLSLRCTAETTVWLNNAGTL